MYFSDYLGSYLDTPLVSLDSNKTNIEKVRTGIYNRLKNISRDRAKKDVKRSSRIHGLLVILGDFSGDLVTIDPPKKICFPEIIGKRYDNGPFTIIHPETKKGVTYETITKLWHDLSFIDLAWLIHIDGTLLGANYDLDVSTRGVSIEPGCGKGNKSAKAYSNLRHVISSFKLSGELDKVVREYVGFEQTRVYHPYSSIDEVVNHQR